MRELKLVTSFLFSATAFQPYELPRRSFVLTNFCCSATRRDTLQILPCTFLFLHANDNSGRPEVPEKQKREDEHFKAALVSASILNSLRQRTPALSCSSPTPLNLATDFYDPTTGLHSEGVWHNSLAGIASLSLITLAAQAPKIHAIGNTSINIDASKRIADSLWGYSWDGKSFQRRSRSGLWDHTALLQNNATLEQPNYYRPSKEHRCIQHGMALLFWSSLVRLLASNDDGDNDYNRYKQQHSLISKSFFQEYWDLDVNMWRTVGKSQGGGTSLRPSASLGKSQKIEDHSDNKTRGNTYYRAVDQAVAVLACIETVKALKLKGDSSECERIKKIIQKSCQTLLSEKDGFGYGSENDARSYIGIERNRNFWHDGWVLLALVCARTIVWSQDPNNGECELRLLFERLLMRYGHLSNSDSNDNGSSGIDGTVWHWAKSLKPDEIHGNVRYCGDNALLYAIICKLNWAPEGGLSVSEYQLAFWNFVKDLRSHDQDGLASVADVYNQVRLHPNTELAALILWQLE